MENIIKYLSQEGLQKYHETLTKELLGFLTKDCSYSPPEGAESGATNIKEVLDDLYGKSGKIKWIEI